MIFDSLSVRRVCVRTMVCIATNVVLCFPTLNPAARAQAATPRVSRPEANQLFVGTCYQPFDRTPAQIHSDIAIMKKAGFNLVRMGDLSWDSFEPYPGKFDFARFDQVMDEMQANGIKVILDIPGTIAPIWLHRKYPGVDLVNQNGLRLPPARRYMDDISDPDYVREVSLLADAMTKHYAHYPAVIAVGYDNEIGNGFMSYSEADRQRFIAWLKRKYGTVEALNVAWASQQWSRQVNSFEDVDLPLGDGPVPPERYLDLHRYWSDVTIDRLKELDQIRRRNMPNLPTASNLWPNAPKRGFDYLGSLKSYATFGTMGFYPSNPLSGAMEAVMIKGDLDTPIWFDEFTAGGQGFYGLPGRSRMYAYLGLTLGAQTVLAWTFNSHLGGEEQLIMGLLNHDGTPSWKVQEFGQVAKEFSKLQTLGFPRHPHPEVAIAYSFASFVASSPTRGSSTTESYFSPAYEKQIEGAFEPFFRDNIDVAILDIGHSDLSRYKLLVVPADYVMDPASASALRRFVAAGGTAVMTAFSAKVDEHSQWFSTPLPGALSDVFGLKTNAFYTAEHNLTFDLGTSHVSTGTRFYEVLEPLTAELLSRFSNTSDKTPAVTVNKFGKGRAIYLATASVPAVMEPVMRYVYRMSGIKPGPVTPAGVMARVVEGRTLYTNTTREQVRIPIDGEKEGLITGRTYRSEVILGPLDVDLVQ